MFSITRSYFNPVPYWENPIAESGVFYNAESVNLFDQNGYHLTTIEQEYAETNGHGIGVRRHETVIRKPWIIQTKPILSGAHINHSDLFERKGYHGKALEQLQHHANHNNLLWKVAKMKTKWGIDISIDYVDETGNVFEVFHYEWDSFEYTPIQKKKEEIEKFVVSQDWNYHAKEIYKRKSEWWDLDFFGQSKWRTDYYNLTPEKFKHVIWDL